MLLNYIKKALTVPRVPSDEEFLRDLIRREAKIGGQLFGTIPDGHRREFFCLDQYTWVWHEEWNDDKGERKSVTTRYDVRPQGIIKVQNNSPYQRLDENELKNFLQATELYLRKVTQELDTLVAQAA